jgi:hypothetical protein
MYVHAVTPRPAVRMWTYILHTSWCQVAEAGEGCMTLACCCSFAGTLETMALMAPYPRNGPKWETSFGCTPPPAPLLFSGVSPLTCLPFIHASKSCPSRHVLNTTAVERERESVNVSDIHLVGFTLCRILSQNSLTGPLPGEWSEFTRIDQLCVHPFKACP